MTSIKDVTDLRVYQHALILYPQIVELVSLIPERFAKQRNQLLNSSVAIAPLIAEGYAKKRNIVELKRFWEIAMGESDELITHLRMVELIIKFCPRVKEEKCDYLIGEYKILSKELNNLIKKWDKYSYQK